MITNVKAQESRMVPFSFTRSGTYTRGEIRNPNK